jgi:hypothetical protein
MNLPGMNSMFGGNFNHLHINNNTEAGDTESSEE